MIMSEQRDSGNKFLIFLFLLLFVSNLAEIVESDAWPTEMFRFEMRMDFGCNHSPALKQPNPAHKTTVPSRGRPLKLNEECPRR